MHGSGQIIGDNACKQRQLNGLSRHEEQEVSFRCKGAVGRDAAACSHHAIDGVGPQIGVPLAAANAG
jgi:hypothetical protein